MTTAIRTPPDSVFIQHVALLVSQPTGTNEPDLVAVRIGVDPALSPIPATQLDGVVGQRAAMDLPAGGLVTRDSIASTVVPAQDMSVVGVAVLFLLSDSTK